MDTAKAWEHAEDLTFTAIRVHARIVALDTARGTSNHMGELMTKHLLDTYTMLDELCERIADIREALK